MNVFKFKSKSKNTLLSRSLDAARQSWIGGGLSLQMSRTKLFLKKQLWAWPIIAVFLLFAIGGFVQSAIESTMKSNLANAWTAFREVAVEPLTEWFRVQESIANAAASDKDFWAPLSKLIDETPDEEFSEKELRELNRKIRNQIGPTLTSYEFDGYFIAQRSSDRIVASSEESWIGRNGIGEYSSFLNRAFSGETLVTAPFPSVIAMETKSGEKQIDEPVMYAVAPIRDESSQVVAALALRIRPESQFTRILQLGRVGESGETYAFDRSGTMVSNSRFDEDLILLGLIPDEPTSRSILQLQVRDPGCNMTEGHRPGVRRANLPLTRMAQDAIEGNTNYDVEGYEDYRGVPVVGAWTWLPKYEIGVATEVDVSQAYRPLIILKQTFWVLHILLGLAAIAIFIFTVIVARLNRKAQEAAIEAQQLGQYTLKEKIGAGAMGEVYRGFHSMLRRPTAVKLLNPELVNDQSVARFEREVQITCKLNNPHTIAIYDYGRTPEGVFYYAMEYLDGINLQELIDDYGPIDEARAVNILNQICSSLFEAHSLGLVHRDIKPANIMLNRRGGQTDVVKVLDFGLVKALDDEKQAKMTRADALTGTPLYMSPEAIQSPLAVDARSDLYAVGAVAYFLLTGRPVFQAKNIVELCQLHVSEQPTPPSKVTNNTISNEMQQVILTCLDKSPANRPPTARNISERLMQSPDLGMWTIADGDAWWGQFERGELRKTSEASSPPTQSGQDSPIDDGRTIIE